MEIRKFQQGGEVQDPAMQQTQQAGPTMDQIIPAMQQAVQNGDCNSLMQVCTAFLQLIAEAQGAQVQAEQPTFARRGGRLVRI